MRVDVSQDVWFLQPVRKHQLLITKKLMRGTICNYKALVEEDGA